MKCFSMMQAGKSCVLILVVLWAGIVCAQSPARTVQGTVRDELRYVVSGAQVTLQGTKYEHAATTRADGTFRVEGAPWEKLTLSVEAKGFARFTLELAKDAREEPIEVVLFPGAVSQEINVTANRVLTSQGETAESVEIVSRRELDVTSTEALDQALRQVPGFTLFRRSDSRTANPTSQGDSLRGVGGSGASRALTLYDDIPLNDPFGGWVYWGRIPREEVSSVELLRGGGSSLYGSGALSGVVNIVPSTAPRTLLSVETSGGSGRTPEVSVASSWLKKPWTFDLDGEGFRSDGYILVPPGQRGAVDNEANASYGTAEVTARRKLKAGDLFFGGQFYNDTRNNGTRLTVNDTQIWQVNGGLNLLTRLAAIELRGYGSGESYNQTFSTVAAGRNSEVLSRVQHVPSQQMGGTLVLSRRLGDINQFVAGADTRYVRGFSNEIGFTSGLATSLVDSGGRQLTSGVFIQDSIRLHPRVLFTIGGRYDNWDNYQADTSTTPLVKTVRQSFTPFPDQSDHAFSPRAALLIRASDKITFSASAYRSFRAPTLNELYRSFRLGNVLTLNNPQLAAERLSGAEGGINVFLKNTRMHAGFFWTQVSDPVANVTLTTTPALITRERENLGNTRSRGVEADVDWRFRRFGFIAAYQYVDATVTSFPAEQALVGLEIPQVAPHQFTFQTRYALPGGWTVATQARASSHQFDDDLNSFSLEPYFQLDAYVSKHLRHWVDVFAAVENLTDSRAQIAKTPLVNVGPPIFARGGLKLHWE
jgi:outer membrane receptor protein involved in Fe transport